MVARLLLALVGILVGWAAASAIAALPDVFDRWIVAIATGSPEA